MVMKDISGVALITGAGSGIGQSVALTFATAGASKLALLDINLEGLAETEKLVKNAHGSKCPPIETIQCDISSPDSVVKAYQQAHLAFGRIDYSIHCAGIMIFAMSSTECPVDSFDALNSINYRGLWLCSREALKIMKTQSLDCEAYPDAGIPEQRAQRGALVNIASVLGLVSMPSSPAYCGAKAGVIALTRCDAVDYIAHRIRVNAIMPGIVDTPMTRPTPEVRAALEEHVVHKTPINRFAMPEEIADTVRFLAGNNASYITGVAVPVDGGMLAIL